jgi:hypothetical protein
MNPSEISNTSIHNEELEHVSWLSAGVGFRADKPEFVDRSPTLKFNFGREQKIDVIRIWNYNEQNLKKRGAKTIEINGLGKIDLPIGDGSAHELSFDSPQPLKTISFKILSNHNGVTYPIPENNQPKDNGFVGLAEVQFLEKVNGVLTLIKNDITVNASSELTADAHDRKAAYLVDGSGFDLSKSAWNQQGMPFYAGKVEYSQTFDIEKIDPAKKCLLQFFPKIELTKNNRTINSKSWYGATAQVIVNGQSAGFLISASSRQQIDVTKFIKNGKNEVAMIVYGTPKNLLGPHHAGKMRGSAWPNAFHRAPEHQPNGAAYDTIGYGLFKPLEMVFTWE